MSAEKKFKPKKDSFSRARGGRSELLDIFCANCNSYVASYQKDGSGQLLRMYLDRIVGPVDLAGLELKLRSTKEMQRLQCPSCRSVIGFPMLYEPENRLAFRLSKGSFAKKKSN